MLVSLGCSSRWLSPLTHVWAAGSDNVQSSTCPRWCCCLRPSGLNQVTTLEAGSGQGTPRMYSLNPLPHVAVQIRGWALETQCALLCWLQWACIPDGRHTCCTVPCTDKSAPYLVFSSGMELVFFSAPPNDSVLYNNNEGETGVCC